MSKEKCLCKNKNLILKKPGRQVKCCAGLRWFYFVAGMAAGCRADEIGRNKDIAKTTLTLKDTQH